MMYLILINNIIESGTFINIGNIPIDYSTVLENYINKLYNVESFTY